MIRRALVAASILLASCGGDDKFPPSSDSAAKCAAPRSGTDSATGKPYPDRQGSIADEKSWLRSWTNERYLWYREVPDPDAKGFATPVDYFAVLKTSAVTASGKPKDQFHFWLSTAAWESFSQSGVEAGYGVQWAVLAPRPPRTVVAAFTEPHSPADQQQIARGAKVLFVDGVDLVNGADVNTLNAGLFPSTAGESHAFTIQDNGSASTRTVTVMSANIQSTPVQNVVTISSAPTVGYMLFNDHIATAEAELVTAVNKLKGAGITDLVLDLRYNGGGYVAIASQLAYMIAGPARTGGKTFEQLVFNDKLRSATPMPFYGRTLGFSTSSDQPLPSLGLGRVFVLTGPGTCSASESVINGLRGADVTVILVGSTTCGKPYGFSPADNCGTTYFSIQFQGVNDKGFGDYADGFTPGGTDPAAIAGCLAADDFTHPLGDPNEARLAAALGYRANQTCPPATSAPANGLVSLAAADGQLFKSPWRENRILRR